MLDFLVSKYTIHRIINLRSAAIVVQLTLVLLVTKFWQYELNLIAVLCVIAIECLFNGVCIAIYREKPNVSQRSLLLQHLSDLAFLTALLYFSGGATNAFVSLLLIPIALAAVTLKTRLLILVSAAAILAYSLLLHLMPEHAMHHMDMTQHFVGMWVNFLFSAIVVSLVVGQMAREIHKKELAIANYREEQLKQEKVISLGVASAQVTHQLATPIATVQLLADELTERDPDDEVYCEIQRQLSRCRDSIERFRQFAVDTKDQRLMPVFCHQIMSELVEHIGINFPGVVASIEDSSEQTDRVVIDASFLPAILNLVQNGARSSQQNKSDNIAVLSRVDEASWYLSVHDHGRGFSKEKLTELGAMPVNSGEGLGLAVFLTHASLERLGGKIELTNADDGGAVVTVVMPLFRE